jgi:hypothetical protein
MCATLLALLGVSVDKYKVMKRMCVVKSVCERDAIV